MFDTAPHFGLSCIYRLLRRKSYLRPNEPALTAGFVFSVIQFAEIVGACIYGNYYQRRCAGIAGHVEGAQPKSAQCFQVLPPEARSLRAPARDYTQTGRHWSMLESLQFKWPDVPAPAGGTVVSGYYGFRELGGVA